MLQLHAIQATINFNITILSKPRQNVKHKIEKRRKFFTFIASERRAEASLVKTTELPPIFACNFTTCADI